MFISFFFVFTPFPFTFSKRKKRKITFQSIPSQFEKRKKADIDTNHIQHLLKKKFFRSQHIKPLQLHPFSRDFPSYSESLSTLLASGILQNNIQI